MDFGNKFMNMLLEEGEFGEHIHMGIMLIYIILFDL